MMHNGLHPNRMGFASPMLNSTVTFNFILAKFWRENTREYSMAMILNLLLMDSAGAKHLVLYKVTLLSQDIWNLSSFITECLTSQKPL